MKMPDETLEIRTLRESLLFELTKALGLSQESSRGKTIRPSKELCKNNFPISRIASNPTGMLCDCTAFRRQLDC